MRKILSIVILLLTSLFAIAEETYIIHADGKLNVRKSPSTSGEIIGTLASQDMVSVYAIDGDWAIIKYNDGVGFIAARYMKRQEVSSVPNDDTELVKETTSSTQSAFFGNRATFSAISATPNQQNYISSQTSEVTAVEYQNNNQENRLRQLEITARETAAQGVRLRQTGAVFMSMGLASVIVGGVFVGTRSNHGSTGLYLAGAGLLGFGSTSVLLSIPLVAVGASKVKNAWNTYRYEKASYSYQLNLNADENGIGLALQF